MNMTPDEGKIHYSLSTLKTNIDWLDKLLLGQNFKKMRMANQEAESSL